MTLSCKVAVVLKDIVQSKVQSKLVVKHTCGVSERKVVAVILVVGQDTCSVGATNRQIGLVFLVTCGNCYVVLYVRTRIEEVLWFVVSVGRSLFVTPTGVTTGLVDIFVFGIRA